MFGILAFGDSITLGSGVYPNKGWAHRLKDYFESKDGFNVVYNLGIPGDSSTDLLQRFEAEVKPRINYIHPGDKFIILIAIGTNDCYAFGNPKNLQTSASKFRKNIRKIINISKQFTKNIVLIGIPPVNEDSLPFEGVYYSNRDIDKLNNILEDIAKINDLFYCEIYKEFINQDYKALLIDPVHPNEKGYNFMYEKIKTFLIKKKLID